ncbi:hypothetical protein M918_20100 [Clostridium sp. BL8]|nr:hypothetical protein M918_20100 [Clostridium sp. BL8]
MLFNEYPKEASISSGKMPDSKVINEIFELTYIAMTTIIPSDTSKEEDFNLWYENFKLRLKNGTRYILMSNDNILKGYLAYSLHYENNSLCIEDLIIDPKYQGDGFTIARLICYFLVKVEGINLNNIYTYTSKLNTRMQGILDKAGFSIEEYNNKSIKYRIDKELITNKYSKLILHFHKKNNYNF